MATINQHYVPRVYLKSWEGSVRSKSEPNKVFQGVYIYNKNDLSLGDGRTRETVLSTNHTYTINYSDSYIGKTCPEILNDFAVQTLNILNRRNVIASYNGTLLTDTFHIAANFTNLENWEFAHKDTGYPASKKAINEIKNIYSYVIETAFSKHVEDHWDNTLSSFVEPAERIPQGHGQIDYTFPDPNIPIKMIEMFAYMASRNPAFNLYGIFPAIKNIILEPFAVNLQNGQQFTDNMMRSLWIAEIYKGLFREARGFFNLFVKETIGRCGFTLFKVRSGDEGCFITSDNPAFTFMSNVTNKNYNGMYFPLTPQYLLFIGLNTSGTISELLIRTIGNNDIKHINRLILNTATKSIVANKRRLGYIL